MKKFIVKTLVLASVLIGMFTNTALASVEQPISFLQYDSQWGNKPYTISRYSGQTMASSGCGPTAAAMVVNYYGNNDITPIEIADYALSNGYRTRSDGTAYGLFSSLANDYNLEYYETYSSLEALNWMNSKEDPLIICSMGPGNWTRNGHYILLWKVENGDVYINDPGSTNSNRIHNTFKKLSSQAKRYFCYNRKPIKEIKITEENNVIKITQEVLYEQEKVNSSLSFTDLLKDLNVIDENKIKDETFFNKNNYKKTITEKKIDEQLILNQIEKLSLNKKFLNYPDQISFSELKKHWIIENPLGFHKITANK